MKKVFCFGELLLRMSLALNKHRINGANVPVYIGGAELNVATALANWNVPTKYCTALPDNYLTKEIIEELQRKEIDTNSVLKIGERIGIYYLPQGMDLKNAGVIYDRTHSSFSMLKPGMIDWEMVLSDCDWFHFSAISPALNNNVAAVCKEALQAATKKGLTISVDLNYRSNLWQYGVQPVDVMPDLVNYCHVVMGNMWSAESLLGIASPLKESKGKAKQQLIGATRESMLQIHQRYTQVTTMAYTFRLTEKYFGVLQHGPTMASSNEYATTNPVDKVGSGDCFMAGLIYGMKKKLPPQQTIHLATAAATGKLFEKGDSTQQTIEQVNARIV